MNFYGRVIVKWSFLLFLYLVHVLYSYLSIWVFFLLWGQETFPTCCKFAFTWNYGMWKLRKKIVPCVHSSDNNWDKVKKHSMGWLTEREHLFEVMESFFSRNINSEGNSEKACLTCLCFFSFSILQYFLYSFRFFWLKENYFP